MATGVSQETVSVVLSDSQQKLVVKISDLTPGAKNAVSLNLISQLSQPLDLSQTKTGCGCMVVKQSDILLKAGSEQQLDLSVQVPPSERRTSFGKNVYLFESSESKIPLVELQIQGAVVPWVSCQSPVVIERTPGLDMQFNATVERSGLNANRFDAIFPTDSKFEWSTQVVDDTHLLFKVRLKEKLIVAGGASWTEVVELKYRDPGLGLLLPVTFEIHQQIAVIPKKAWERENGYVVFSVIGLVSDEHEFELVDANQPSKILNYEVKSRSRRVRDFMIDMSSVARKPDGALAVDQLEFRWRTSGADWCRIELPVVSLQGMNQ